MTANRFDEDSLKTIFDDCRQCGTCCREYKKIILQPEEIEFIEKMGGHVGTSLSMAEIREKGLSAAMEEAARDGKVYMVHPDENGCVFLEHKNDKFYCRIYHYRPKTCQGFRCNLADDSFLQLFGGENGMHLLGQDAFGLPLK